MEHRSVLVFIGHLGRQCMSILVGILHPHNLQCLKVILFRYGKVVEQQLAKSLFVLPVSSPGNEVFLKAFD